VYETRDVSRQTPLRGIIRRLLEQSKAPIACDELTAHVVEAWQRPFPQNPYEDPCLIYKLVGAFPDVEMHYDDLEDIPLVELNGQDPILVTPRLDSSLLNEALDQIKRIKFSIKR
jgi:hypothetical protein